MKKMRFIGLFVLVVSVSLVFGGGIFQKAQCAKSYNLKFQMAWHTQHPEYKAYQEFIKMVDEASGGRLKFTLFPASQLIGREQALDGLAKGTIDMMAGSAVYYHGMVPEGDVDWLPYMVLGNREVFWDFMNYRGGGNRGEFRDIIYDAYLKKANAVWLTNIICGGEGIIGRGNNAYDSLEKIKGIKLRAAGGVATRVAAAWGASPVTMATGELYPALQRGTVDALIFPMYGLKDYKFFEVAKTYTDPPVFIWCDDLWINKDSFERLPKDLQTILYDVAHKWGRWASVEYWPAYEEENKKWCEEKGVKFFEMSDADIEKSREMMKEVWDWYANESPECKRLIELLVEEQKTWK